MSAADAQAEPTMEEILASIRKIISEDEDPAPAEDVLDLAEAEPVIDFAEPEPETVGSDFDFDALGGDDDAGLDAAQGHDFGTEDLMVSNRYEPEPEPAYEPPVKAPERAYEPPPRPAPQPVAPLSHDGIERLVGDSAAAVASSTFARINQGLPGAFLSGNTVEALVADLLKPMLREWLDNNLPRIVEEKVEAEVARLARRGF